jgi:cell division septal protein FtsQ
MPYYQGRALQNETRPRRRGGRLRRLSQVLGLVLLATILAHVPWGAVRGRLAVVDDVHVRGAHYLDPARIADVAGLHRGDDLLAVDYARARQMLLLQSRIADARVAWRPPRVLQIDVVEREPVLLVPHGVPWELDSTGVLLEPLQRGVVADVPLLVGSDVSALRAGTHVGDAAVGRGLAWVRSLSRRDLQLEGRVSEIDVSDPLRTALTLLSGTRVVAPAWPPSLERLSALRVVLIDLERKGTPAEEVDVRFERQVIVRPAVTAVPGATTGRG